MNLSMNLWHSNNMKVIWHKFPLNFCLNTELCWLYFVFVLISSTWLTINPNNQNEKHDQTFIFANRVLKNQTCFFAHQSCCLSFCLSLCMYVCLWRTFFRAYEEDILNFLHEDILPYILQSDKARFWKIVFIV